MDQWISPVIHNYTYNTQSFILFIGLYNFGDLYQQVDELATEYQLLPRSNGMMKPLHL